MSKKTVIGTTSVGLFSSVLAFLGVVSCCGMPIAAGILAWLGIGASQLSFFAEYRPLFIGIAIVALLFGFWQVYFKKRSSCCASGSGCCETAEKEEKPKSQLVQKVFLWIGAIVVIAMLFRGTKKLKPPKWLRLHLSNKLKINNRAAALNKLYDEYAIRYASILCIDNHRTNRTLSVYQCFGRNCFDVYSCR